jgi:dienelactone hydrolase
MTCGGRRFAACAAVATLLPLLLSPANALAAEPEIVSFRSATVPPTPLRIRLASERGQTPVPGGGDELIGYLYRPPGDGPFPAIVGLHGCDGRTAAGEARLAAPFVSSGYVFLSVDSFSSRGIGEGCSGAVAPRTADAFGGLNYLVQQPFVIRSRVAVLGFSQGGGAALETVAQGGFQDLMTDRFRAAVAYYPVCNPGGLIASAPTLILIGDLDDWTPAEDCREMITRGGSGGAPIMLTVYPLATHAFNVPRSQPERSFGHWLEYDESAARDASRRVAAFLKEQLGK